MDLGVPSPLEWKGKEQAQVGREPAHPPGCSPAPPGLLQEEEGKDDGDTLELYQQSLGELLLLLAGELWPWWVLRGRGTDPAPMAGLTAHPSSLCSGACGEATGAAPRGGECQTWDSGVSPLAWL